MRGDEQKPDMRCGTSGTSGHVTTKSSIRNRDVLYKSGVYAWKVTRSYPGRSVICQDQPLATDCLAEKRAIPSDRMTEVSRGHSRCGNEPHQKRNGEVSPNAEGLNGMADN